MSLFCNRSTIKSTSRASFKSTYNIRRRKRNTRAYTEEVAANSSNQHRLLVGKCCCCWLLVVVASNLYREYHHLSRGVAPLHSRERRAKSRVKIDSQDVSSRGVIYECKCIHSDYAISRSIGGASSEAHKSKMVFRRHLI